jgi:hypothetical protein
LITTILQHTPGWVWLLLAGLLALGLWQRLDRSVRPGQLFILPGVLLALGLSTLAPVFLRQPLVAPVWLAALALGATAGSRWPAPRGTRWLPEQGRLHLPGSWLPMALIVLIFGLRYSAGVAQGLHPEWRALWPLQAAQALLFGGVSGLLAGRALALRRLAGHTMPAHA